MIEFPGAQSPPPSVIGGWDEVSAETQQDSCHINIYLARETQTIRCVYIIHTCVMNSPFNRYSLFGAWPSHVLRASVAALSCWGFARSGEAELMPVIHWVSLLLGCHGGLF